MSGREDKQWNDLFFTCSLIEYIARKTHNKRAYIVNQMGSAVLEHILSLSDVYHSDNIDDVSDRFITECNIIHGSYNNVSKGRYTIPSHWDIGKVYKRLIQGASLHKNTVVIDELISVYNSDVSDLIQDYNSSFYYDPPQNILNAYIYGMLED